MKQTCNDICEQPVKQTYNDICEQHRSRSDCAWSMLLVKQSLQCLNSMYMNAEADLDSHISYMRLDVCSLVMAQSACVACDLLRRQLKTALTVSGTAMILRWSKI